jgi:hypothetical protein
MNITRALATLCFAALSAALPLAAQTDLPELRVLQLEYQNAVDSRVTDPHNAALAKLDARYLGGVENGLAAATAAGDLESALSLEAEKKRIASKEALPADDEQASKALRKLRGIYRVELAKLDAQRLTNYRPVLTEHLAKLKKLEIDLTKATRLADAKAVMDYRNTFVEQPAATVSSGTRLAENITFHTSGCDFCTLYINGKELLSGVRREAPSVASHRVREGDVIAVSVMNSRFDINSFWLSAISSNGEFLFETSEQWTGYVPADEAKWWVIKEPKEQKPVKFAPDSQEYVDRVKHSASQTPLYEGIQPIRSMVKNAVGATWVYYVVTKADLIPKPDRKAAQK